MNADIERAAVALLGLAVGDGLGGFCEFSHGTGPAWVRERRVPQVEWHWTDDTHTAISIMSILARYGSIDQAALAQLLAERYERSRGYGMSTRAVLKGIRSGEDWSSAAQRVFGGAGSLGNGSASRVPPLGAFFAADLERVVYEAQLSSAVTHAHPEAPAGASAVALAAAQACHWSTLRDTTDHFLDAIIPFVPHSLVRERLEQARQLAADTVVGAAAMVLGNGQRPTAPETVPFALWCAAQHLDDYEEAIWAALEGQGDTDTVAAIVGGVVVLNIGVVGIPERWQQLVEPLPSLW